MKVITPNDWGPFGWKFLHFSTLGYPNNPTEQDKIKYKKFYESLGDVLPCILCANHYKENLKIHTLDKALESRENLILWGINMHNEVNKKNWKKQYKYDEGVMEILKNLELEFNKPPIYSYIFIIVLIIILMIGVYLLLKKNRQV